MNMEDKAKNKAQEMKGQAKEEVGKATGDEDMQAEGQADKRKGSLKQAAAKIRDAFKS